MDQDRSRQANQGPDTEGKSASVSEAINRGRDAIGGVAADAIADAAADLQAIRNDLDNLKSTLARFVAQAREETVKSARDVSSTMADQVGDAANDLAGKGSAFAAAAGDQAKTLAGEIEAFARRNPLGALAGAVAVGFVIGLWGRRS
jgi:ElaB/YqjD/DUF883 family membrane-anchored ribosome-binding protein